MPTEPHSPGKIAVDDDVIEKEHALNSSLFPARGGVSCILPSETMTLKTDVVFVLIGCMNTDWAGKCTFYR
jgi:hypothetical protein